MTIEEALYYHLTANTGVAALISTRLYPLTIPQDISLPAVAYQRISGVRELDHDGPSGFARARVQFTCQAATYSAAKGLVEAIRQALDGYTGLMGGVGGLLVEYCSLANEIDGYEFETEAATVRADVVLLYQGEELGDPLEVDGGEYLEV